MDYRDLDARHVWHPYTEISHPGASGFPVITRAQGIYLYTDGGFRLMDGISSWWSAALGHGQPKIIQAIQKQAVELQHSILGGLTHPRAVELAARLAAICPGDLNHVHFASDGASAVECALKVALQYWHNLDQPRRKKFICLENAYHGDTLGAVGVGFIPSFHHPFKGAVVEGLRAPSPYDPTIPPGRGLDSCAPGSLEAMVAIIKANAAEVAAVIIEPVVMGAAGVWIYPPEYVAWLRELCTRHDLLLIADEIAVGLGRTGKMWACDHAGVVPDLLCVGKALTGGSLPLSAMIATDRVYEAFRGPDRMLYHGHTFCGNPIACAAALAALDIFEAGNIVEKSLPVAERMAAGLAEIVQDNPHFRQSRAIGMVGMIEVDPVFAGIADGHDASANRAVAYAATVGRRALERGLFLRPLGSSIYLWPPLTTTPAEMDAILEILENSLP